TTIYTAPAGETHFRDETVNADSTYYYRIRTKLPNGTSSFIPSEYGISTRTAYPLETRLSGFALSDTQIKLEWDASMLNGGRVYLQKKDAAGNFYIIFNSDTESSYVDTTVAKGKTYSYRLYVTSKNGTSSEYTTEAAVTVEQVPGPSDPAVVAMPDNRAVLSWAYPYEVETGFEVWRKDSGYWDKIASLPKNTVTYTDTGIEGGKAYSYKLRAMRGETSFSTFTQAVTVNNTTPQEPKKPICVALQGFLTIYSAENVPANSVYTLEYRTDLNGEWKDYKSASQGPLTAYMSYNASSQFDFRLRANVGSLYVYSPVYHFYGSVPEKVQDVKVPIAGYERVILTWRDTTSKEESFHIYRTVKGNRELIGTANVNEERFIDDTPASGETCRYEVVPYNACGESASVATTIKVPKIVLFKDISSVSWAHDAIYKLLGLGALSGSQTNFYPNGTLSRGEFTHMALRAFGITYLGSYSFTLSDASPAHPYYEDLMNAVALGLAAPDAQGRILPNQPITRGEIAILLSNILNQLGKPLTSYAADTLEGYKDAETLTPENTALIASLVGDGIITGRSGQLLGLGSKATRVEAAAIVYRALEKYVP
ncbi:MAG: S-layer homology domain-containing protein, partial [Clostridia bacterium]|nr:S-layer homology domain-containing protein [Clostridia bacterium]